MMDFTWSNANLWQLSYDKILTEYLQNQMKIKTPAVQSDLFGLNKIKEPWNNSVCSLYDPETDELTAVGLIGLVLAVRIAVTLPGQPHTLSVGTAKLPCAAVCPAVQQVRDAVAAAALRPFVRAVGAVGVPVAAPHEWHALRGVAAQMVGPAGQRGGALELVAAVPAVVITVTHVGGGQALAVGAHELAVGAGFGI